MCTTTDVVHNYMRVQTETNRVSRQAHLCEFFCSLSALCLEMLAGQLAHTQLLPRYRASPHECDCQLTFIVILMLQWFLQYSSEGNKTFLKPMCYMFLKKGRQHSSFLWQRIFYHTLAASHIHATYLPCRYFVQAYAQKLCLRRTIQKVVTTIIWVPIS